jgi:hypothetical protein
MMIELAIARACGAASCAIAFVIGSVAVRAPYPSM